jgi:hypothetical protein
MGNWEKDIFLDGVDPEQGSFFVAGGAEEPCLARERDGHTLPAVGTPVLSERQRVEGFIAGDALARVAAG